MIGLSAKSTQDDNGVISIARSSADNIIRQEQQRLASIVDAPAKALNGSRSAPLMMISLTLKWALGRIRTLSRIPHYPRLPAVQVTTYICPH
eukprot:scaffold173975_cov18-Prasinocladus_malaysianus.AAC.1